MAFELTPAASVPSKSRDGFPDYLQLQSNGTNLGGRDVDTINFGTGVTATRGTGATANVATVTAVASPGGGAQKLYLYLDGPPGDDPDVKFNRDIFTDWVAELLVSSEQAEWNPTTKSIDILVPGYYEFRVRARIEADPQVTGDWPSGMSVFGIAVDAEDWSTQTTLHWRDKSGQLPGSGGNEISEWTDIIAVPIGIAGPVKLGLFAEAYDSLRETPAHFSCEVIIERVGDAPVPT
jgi:hypothetical protein